MSEDRCICCGAIIPEGVTVCPSCLLAVKPRKEKSKVELKPCPFCGKPVSMIYNSFENAFKFYHKNGMDDLNCCVIEPIMLKGHSLADAAKAWNRRTKDD